MSDPIDHHYLPVFYLKQWANANGRIVRYHRPYREVVLGQIAPSNTGYEPYLYTLEGYPPAARQAIEKEFMGPVVDGPAAEALRILIERDKYKLTQKPRSDWTRYLMSLRLRNPEMMADINHEARSHLSRELSRNPKEYEAVKRDSDPATLLELVERNAPVILDNFGKSLLPALIDNQKIGQAIFDMSWWVVDFFSSAVSLLTSDRPFVMTAALKADRCVIALPLGPRHAFFAARHNHLITGTLGKKGVTGVAKALNESIVTQAIKHVYGADRFHLRFVEKRLGSGQHQSLFRSDSATVK
jgi:hypothetical protein